MKRTALVHLIFSLFVSLALAACGFHMRGSTDLSFQTIYIQNNGTGIMSDLKRLLLNNKVKMVAADQAELQLELMREVTDKRILSLSGRGKVKEYELLYNITFRTREAGSELWSAPQKVEDRRDFSYDDTQLLAKDYEEAQLYRDMRTDAARKIIRLLGALKTTAKPSATN